MTLRRFVLSPTGGTSIYLEYSGSSNSQHLLYLLDIVVYSGCSLYDPYFYSTGTTASLLSCGNLVSDLASVGNYVIEWHLNSTGGTTVLVSGNSGNTDASIEVYHSFTNVPVPGGTLYPVIKYVYLDGYKYSSIYNFWDSSRYSPDLINCLSPVIVSDMTCYNGTLINQDYTHTINYDYSNMNLSQSTRSFNFILNTGGTTKYFAFDFVGYQVPDTIKITYSGSTIQELAYWTVGSDNSNITNYTSTPKKYGYGPFNVYNHLKMLCNYSAITYTTGDYLKIDITPNSATTNTNWQLYMTCMTGSTFSSAFNCDNFPYGTNIINTGSTSMTFITGDTCYYELKLNLMSGNTNFYNSDFYKYISYQSISNLSNYDGNMTYITTRLAAPSTGYTVYAAGGYGNCQSLNNYMTSSLSGNNITLTFQDNNDYLLYKNSYFSTTGNSWMNNYTSDILDPNYYKVLSLNIISGISCGDTQSYGYAYFHYSSPVTFNDISKIITITMSGATNGFTSGISCNNAYFWGEWCKNICTINSNLNVTTNITYQYPFGYGIFMSQPSYNTLETSKEFYHIYTVHPTVLNNVCYLSNPWCFNSGGSSIYFANYTAGNYCMFKALFKVEITNSADPINNYKIYSGIDYSTGLPTDYYQIYP